MDLRVVAWCRISSQKAPRGNWVPAHWGYYLGDLFFEKKAGALCPGLSKGIIAPARRTTAAGCTAHYGGQAGIGR
jgi:hypothetical protein